MAHLASALRFVDAFPETEAFNVTLLTEEKRSIIVKPQCSNATLLKELNTWLSMEAMPP